MKPMLLSNADYELEDLDYTNMYISAKRDGVRAEVTNVGIMNRSLKWLRNAKMQEWFKPVWSKLPEGVIIEAEICDESLPCRTIAGICNSDAHDIPKGLKMYVFGLVDDELNFKDRNGMLYEIMSGIKSTRYQIVKQLKINNVDEAKHAYQSYIDAGYEGAVLMDGRKMYKHGRVTVNQHIGFKLKKFREDDIEIIGVTERLENTNESQTNELGNSFKRNTKLDKEETGIAATFIVKLNNDKECKVTITGDESFRREIWKNKKSYIGKFAVVKSMDYGIKTRLRHPTLIRIKEKIEK